MINSMLVGLDSFFYYIKGRIFNYVIRSFINILREPKEIRMKFF